MADDKKSQPESNEKDQPRPEPVKDLDELSPEELDKVSAGAGCASGTHLDKPTLTR